MAMIRTNGFVPLRRGLQEHVMQGIISINDAWLYVSMLLNADPKSGVWIGSAEALALLFALDPRTCQRAMLRLENKEYIKRIFTRGKNGSFPILIHRYECSIGSLKGKRLNAIKSTSLENLFYLGVGEVSDEVSDGLTDGVSDEVSSLYRNGDMTHDTGRSPAPRKTATPRTSVTKGDSLGDKDRSPDRAKAKEERHTEFKGILGEYWASKNEDAMPWDGSEGKALSQLLAANPQLESARFRVLLRNRFKSQINHAERPRAWIASITDYASGPLDRFKKPEENSNGKNQPNNQGAAVGRVGRSGAGFGAATERRVAQASGSAAPANVGGISQSGSGAGDSGGVLPGVRDSSAGVRDGEPGTGAAHVSDEAEIFPPSQRSTRGA